MLKDNRHIHLIKFLKDNFNSKQRCDYFERLELNDFFFVSIQMLQVNNRYTMLSASILNEKILLSVVSLLIIYCTLDKLVVKKKKAVFKRNQMINCFLSHHHFHCHSHSFQQPNYNCWHNTQMTMASMLVTMRGKKKLNSIFFYF